MPTRRVDCGDVFYPDPVIGGVVGSGAIWGDDSDLTFADSTAIGGSGGHVDWPAAYVVNPGGSFAVDTLTIHLRAAPWDLPLDVEVGIYAGTTVGLGDNDLTSLIEPTATTQVLLSGATADYVIESSTPASFVNVLTGAWFVTVVPQAVDEKARIYELWFEVGTRGSAPLRRFPAVNNGGSGPTRHYPRTVSRRAGGTY